MMGYYDGYGAMGFGFGWFFMILFWVLIIWAVVALIRWLSMGSHGHGGYHHQGMHGSHWASDRSIQILNERYAKGEITKEQFEEMKKNLST